MPAPGQARSRGVTFETVVRLGLALPGVEEGLSYGTPALKVGGKLLARLKEDGDTLALKCTFEERETLLRRRPSVFFLTDHYLNYPWVLVRLPRVSRDQVRVLLGRAWSETAPRRPTRSSARKTKSGRGRRRR